MKSRVIISFILVLNIHFSFSQSCLDKKRIYTALVEYTSEWDYTIIKKVSNSDFADLIRTSAKTEDLRKVIESDSLLFNNEYVSYYSSVELEDKNGERLNGVKSGKSDSKKSMKLSSILFSLNGKTAFVYVTTHCGKLCGSGELFILEKEKENWTIKDRKLHFIS